MPHGQAAHRKEMEALLAVSEEELKYNKQLMQKAGVVVSQSR